MKPKKGSGTLLEEMKQYLPQRIKGLRAMDKKREA